MVDPLEKLKVATNNIRAGNLDEPVVPEMHYNRELKDTFRDFEKMRQQLKENKMMAQQYEENRKDLISNISHDLKTPIASIIGYVEGIYDGIADTPAKRERYMQIIYKKSLDMNRLVNDLILFSKLDVNKVAFKFDKMNFQIYMETLFEEYGIELQENQIELVSRYQATENMMLGIDAKQLRRVFNNIIGNAMKHLNKENKAIEIVVYEERDEVVIRISDNGVGIPKDKVDFIFDRFYKGDPSRNTEVGSSGLGLSISKQIVLAHGGRIWATSEVGEGTIVYFTISKKEEKRG
nr:HAMP domain-containing sensor histidine kinase [Acidaminobacter sp. JC074]